MIDLHLQVRTADPRDHQALSSLIFFETHAHRHLDWRMPLDWLGSPYFWVLEDNQRIIAALACPPDPPGVAWIRLFAHNGTVAPGWAWPALWESAQREVAQRGGAVAAAIVRQDWFQRLLIQAGFQQLQSIVLLEWRGRPIVMPRLSSEFYIRPLTVNDLPAVAEVDLDAFGPFWHNSLDMLERAYSASVSAKVVEANGRLLGYQLSTGHSTGAHLARLAVRKEAQRLGLGKALVSDLILEMRGRAVNYITVNTQSDNRASLALYQQLGFTRTGEQYPVYTFDIPSI